LLHVKDDKREGGDNMTCTPFRGSSAFSPTKVITDPAGTDEFGVATTSAILRLFDAHCTDVFSLMLADIELT